MASRKIADTAAQAPERVVFTAARAARAATSAYPSAEIPRVDPALKTYQPNQRTNGRKLIRRRNRVN